MTGSDLHSVRKRVYVRKREREIQKGDRERGNVCVCKREKKRVSMCV